MSKYPKIRLVGVDDSETCLHALKTHITESKLFNNSNLHFFSDPLKAFDYIRKNEIDILITDYRMPYVDGVLLISDAKKIRPELKTALFASSKIITVPGGKYRIEDYVDIVAEKDPQREKIINLVEQLCEMIRTNQQG